MAAECTALLTSMSRQYDLPVYAYCLMPDHAHLLLSASERMDVVRFVGMWKGKTTRIGWKHGLTGGWWQARFYDHVLRREEDLREVCRYILLNPVRADLADDWHDYPFAGSLVFHDL